ncbi:MAG: LPS assembly lipoprotein LptE [Desulfobacterales bacterium]|jgi:outer membrane lipopolysaccharide assembly protein LptE/RlpB|nr:LPS assembly lipoprotein LptE [Desulfobacterales bacterium]
MNPAIPPRKEATLKKRQTAWWIAVATAAALAIGGCGYRFQAEAKLPGGAQTVFVSMFENRTNEPALETTVTNAVVFEFTKRSRTALVGSESQADLVMRGVIRSVELRTVASRNRDGAGERSVTLTLDVRLVEPGGKEVWSATGLSDSQAFVVGDDKILTEQRQRATLGVVATRIAERIYNRFTDNF